MVSENTWNWLRAHGRDYHEFKAGDIAILGWEINFYKIPDQYETHWFATKEWADDRRGMVKYETEADYSETLWNAFILADAWERNADLAALHV